MYIYIYIDRALSLSLYIYIYIHIRTPKNLSPPWPFQHFLRLARTWEKTGEQDEHRRAGESCGETQANLNNNGQIKSEDQENTGKDQEDGNHGRNLLAGTSLRLPRFERE